jgi:hypothetical protein
METPPFDAGLVINDAINALGPQLFSVAGAALAVGVGILALTKGWGFVKKFI